MCLDGYLSIEADICFEKPLLFDRVRKKGARKRLVAELKVPKGSQAGEFFSRKSATRVPLRSYVLRSSVPNYEGEARN